MSYTPIGWQTGDTITAEKLNKMDNGWSVESSSTTYINESVTTEDRGNFGMGATSYSNGISDATLTITFNGTEYTCTLGPSGYGATAESPTPDFTTYPFGLVPMGPVLLITETAGTYTLKVEASSTTVQTSTNFQTAVGSVVDINTIPFKCISGSTTYDEMAAARDSGSLLYFYKNSSACHFITDFSNEVSATAVDALPAGTPNVETYGFNNNMVFTIYTY